MRLLFIFICFLFTPLLSAQESNTGNWLIYIGSKQIDSKWNIHHEVQYRNYNVIGDLEQLLLRTGIGYQIAKNTNLLLGYGHITSGVYLNDEDKENVYESRIYQQLITKQKIGKVGLQHRYRIEERFVPDDFKMRFRYFLSANLPLTTDQKFYLSAYNEIFINTEGNYFDRNRIYGGAGYKLNDKLKLEVGYMNQILSNRSRGQSNLILFANF